MAAALTGVEHVGVDRHAVAAQVDDAAGDDAKVVGGQSRRLDLIADYLARIDDRFEQIADAKPPGQAAEVRAKRTAFAGEAVTAKQFAAPEQSSTPVIEDRASSGRFRPWKATRRASIFSRTAAAEPPARWPPLFQLLQFGAEGLDPLLMPLPLGERYPRNLDPGGAALRSTCRVLPSPWPSASPPRRSSCS